MVFVAAPQAAAQRPALPRPPEPLRVRFQRPLPSSDPFAFRTHFVADSVVIPKTHWLEGGAILGGLMGLGGVIGGLGFCHYDGPCRQPVAAATAGLVVSGLVGFGVGALIGGQFPKHAHANTVPQPE